MLVWLVGLRDAPPCIAAGTTQMMPLAVVADALLIGRARHMPYAGKFLKYRVG